MTRPMFASFTYQAEFDAKEQGLSLDRAQAMELIGQIADHDFYYGPLETKLQLVELLINRRSPAHPGVMAHVREIAAGSDLDDHSTKIQLIALMLRQQPAPSSLKENA